MAVPEYTVITGTDHPDFAAATVKLTGAAWPEFMLHDPLAEYFNSLYRHLPQFQFALVQKGSDTWMAMGNSIPLAWDGRPADLPDTGWDWAMEKGIKDFETARRPTVLCALQVVVASDFKGKGVSFQAVRTMTSIGKAHGLGAMIAPVRPSMKSRYPLTPMERFISWKNDDGLPFDSWMRVHARLGADVIGICPESMRITGSVTEWERWTDMRFPESDDYIVPGALVPVTIDRENDRGTYIEPNVWMMHRR